MWMPDALSAQVSPDGLIWLAGAAFLASLVRGFAGFGTGLIFMPLAAQVVPPIWAIAAISVLDVLGPAPLVRGALKAAHRGDLLRLLAGLAALLPAGLWALDLVSGDQFRGATSVLALAMLAALALGVKYWGKVRKSAVIGIGGASGFLGGVAGLPGPPVILFYLARPLPAAVIRANTLLFLLGYDLLIWVCLVASGRFDLGALCLGLGLAGPAVLGNALGARLFRLGHEALYRWIAFAVIAVSGLSGLGSLG